MKTRFKTGSGWPHITVAAIGLISLIGMIVSVFIMIWGNFMFGLKLLLSSTVMFIVGGAGTKVLY
jgi:hypothetical protein